MNPRRARTQRRLKARQALISRYRDLSGAVSDRPVKSSKEVRKLHQQEDADRTPVTLALDFEIQTKDKGGRWRKTAGVPRVHSFGLARLRAWKFQGRADDGTSLLPPYVRVRNIVTGDVWQVTA